MDIQKIAAALTEHIPDGDERKTRINEGLVILKGLNERQANPARFLLNNYSMAGLVRLVTRRHAMEVPIRQYATDLHEYWIMVLDVQPDGSMRNNVETVAPRYLEPDPEADAIGSLTDLFQQGY
jgi:hypothetical protein